MTLTREEILAMEPGRRLDSEIGMRIMGFKEITIVGDYYFTDPIDTQLKRYSTDISAAWEVFESFNDMRIQRYETMGGTFKYGCRIDYIVEKEFQSAITNADTAPEAICKAALLAVLNL